MADADPLAAVEQLLDAMLAGLEPVQRRRLMLDVARELRRENVERQIRQRGPDGSPWAPRKPREPIRARGGRIRRAEEQRKMFTKLRRSEWLRASAEPDEARVGYVGTAARIARVHHSGLRDRVSREAGAPEATYPERPLLGLTDISERRILDALLKRVRLSNAASR